MAKTTAVQTLPAGYVPALKNVYKEEIYGSDKPISQGRTVA